MNNFKTFLKVFGSTIAVLVLATVVFNLPKANATAGTVGVGSECNVHAEDSSHTCSAGLTCVPTNDHSQGNGKCQSTTTPTPTQTPHHNTCNSDHQCVQVTGAGQDSCNHSSDCQVATPTPTPTPVICEDNEQSEVGPKYDEEETDNDDNCVTPTVTPTPTTPVVTPTNTPSNGGNGGGPGDGLGCSTHDCSGNHAGGSNGTTQAVLGASTFAGTGTFETAVMDIMLVAGMIVLSLGGLSYAKEKKN